MKYHEAPEHIRAATDWLLKRRAEQGALTVSEQRIGDIVLAEIRNKRGAGFLPVVIHGGKNND